MDIEYARTISNAKASEDVFQVDSQVSKTHYARDNNDKILTFVIQEDPNLCLDLSSITIGFSVEFPSERLPDNCFAAKLFKTLNIEINSQLITSTKAL